MISSVSNMSIPSISYTFANNGKMTLPVDSSSLVYSHLKHISGVAAPEGTQGVSISKLNLLDVLISRLNDTGKNAFSPNQASFNAAHFKGQYSDALIESYTNQIRQAQASSNAMPYIPSPNASSGAVFNILY